MGGGAAEVRESDENHGSRPDGKDQKQPPTNCQQGTEAPKQKLATASHVVSLDADLLETSLRMRPGLGETRNRGPSEATPGFLPTGTEIRNVRCFKPQTNKQMWARPDFCKKFTQAYTHCVSQDRLGFPVVANVFEISVG